MEKNISNRRVYTYIAIIFLVIFIIGLIALGVFRFASGSGSNTPTYYSYAINNSNLPDGAGKDDDHTFTLRTEIKYHEVMVFHADNSAVVGTNSNPDAYLFGGVGISFTLKIEEEQYYLSVAAIDQIRVANSDSSTDTYLLPENSYTRTYKSSTREYEVILNNTEARYIHSISLTYGVGKK